MTYSTAWDVESSFNMELPGNSDARAPAQSSVMPDIYAKAATVNKPEPKVVAQSLPNIDKSIGFNPYDTGVLQQQKIKG